MSVHARHGWQWLAACAMAVAFMLMTPPAVLAQATDASPEGEPSSAAAQAPSQSKPSFEVYGFAMLDMGYDFKQIHPNWFDTMRVTKLPSFENQFGEDHNTFAGVRQSRLGVRSSTPTALGDLKTTFEFELFGTGVDEGQTTFRLRHAYGEVGRIRRGADLEPLHGSDVFPNSVEYWGPTGMVFFRNVQFRWIPVQDSTRSLRVAAERPGASGDRASMSTVSSSTGCGRVSVARSLGRLRIQAGWGYARVAGILRRINWDDTNDGLLRLQRRRHRVGHQPESRTSSRPPRTSSACSSCLAKASRTT